MGSQAPGAWGEVLAMVPGMEHEKTISNTTGGANRVERLGASTVGDYPLESLAHWIITQQQRSLTRVRAPSLVNDISGPLPSPDGGTSVAPSRSPQSRATLSSISSFGLPFFTGQCVTATSSIGSSLHSSAIGNSAAAPNANNATVATATAGPAAAVAAVVVDSSFPLFYTFFYAASSTSSLESFPSTVGVDDDEEDEDEEDDESVNEKPSRHRCDEHQASSDVCDSDTESWGSSGYTTTTMPSSTLAAPARDGAVPLSSTDFLANFSFETAANNTTAQFRPQSATSARSARSPSPLFARWTRRHHPQHSGRSDSGGRKNHSKTRSSSRAAKKTKEDGLTRAASITKRPLGSSPQLTREEFEALPLAIQRKYFSTLERLRFAQESGAVDGISQHYNDISAQNAKRRKPRQERSASDNLGQRVRRGASRESHLPPASSQPLTDLPAKVKPANISREEQVFLARQLRASVILDAADEAVYRIGRRASKQLASNHLAPATELLSPVVSSRRNSMESEKRTDPVQVPESFYDSFRWLDDEEDLDLRLFLDDYHSNLREEVPCPTKERRPSFRRHLSISKIPFGRSSVSSSRPATKDAASPMQPSPSQSPIATTQGNFAHGRRKSRALSLITPKHTTQDSITAFDPAAAHYQDPEARLKLRVYLASPQKFDEAIEFGFPSTDVLSAAPVIANDARPLDKRQSRLKLVDDPAMRTFLADDDDDDDDDDDKISLNSDQPSIADPESPRTPQYFETNKPTIRPTRVSSENHMAKPSDGGYTQLPASSREMTLRMTLTRPDLRANEDQIYGWQSKGGPQQARKSLSSPMAMELPPVTYIGDSQQKESIEKVFAGIDHWNATQPTDGGVMKRIWNRVRRS